MSAIVGLRTHIVKYSNDHLTEDEGVTNMTSTHDVGRSDASC
jgi:hypothetical protein